VKYTSRREFIKHVGIGAAAVPLLGGLPSLATAAQAARRKQRLVIVFSPNGVVPKTFWPDAVGSPVAFKESLKPLEPFRDQTLILRGLSQHVRGDGDNHMRGIGCLLTGIELFPGNIQGGSDTPAGWASGISIDQEIRNFLQKDAASRTRFGSLEFGVLVPDHANTWTRMVYTGANKPVEAISDPYRMFGRLYGQLDDQDSLKSILDDLREDLARVRKEISVADRKLLDEHTALVREMEKELAQARTADVGHAVPKLEAGVRQENDNMVKLSKLQIDLMVSAFLTDACRVATLQYTNSVGQARFTWLGIGEGHHDLSHEPDTNEAAQQKLTKINHWYAQQIAYLAQRLADTPEPGGKGSMLDNTLIVWTNELGQGNNHTLNNIPFVLLGGGAGFKMGRYVNYENVAHNRFLMALAHAYGHRVRTFGNPDVCGAGPLSLS
jgi:hypothetical protein